MPISHWAKLAALVLGMGALFVAELRARGIDTLIVGGFMTHLAVLSTASDAALLDYHVFIAADATATRALPGAGGERGVDSQSLERAVLAVLADRVADVLPSRTSSPCRSSVEL